MSAQNDGGPAFPIPAIVTANGGVIANGRPGMSLRHWSATTLLAGIFSNGEALSEGIQPDIDMAIKYADELIESLARKEDA